MAYRRHFTPSEYQDALQFLALRGIELKKSRATSEQGRRIYIARIASDVYRQEQVAGKSFEQASKKEREEARKAARGHAPKPPTREGLTPEQVIATPKPLQKASYHKRVERETYTMYKNFKSLEELRDFQKIAPDARVEIVARGKTKDGKKTGGEGKKGKTLIYRTLTSQSTFKALQKTLDLYLQGKGGDISAIKQFARNLKNFDSVQNFQIRVRK